MSQRVRIGYIAVFVVGAVFMLAPALTDVFWFDEAYSIALARQSLPEIWRIGAADVHPLLYYVLLHGVRAVFGESVVAYRLFSVAGMIATALLGPTLVRRDFGARVGLLYSALVLFTPYALFQATEIRMYSWAMFTVMLCFLMMLRIVYALRQKSGEDVPFSWWLDFGISSFAAASLHYYALLAAFMLNLMVLIELVRVRAPRREALRFVASAVLQVALYAPWLLTLIAKMGDMTGGRFWIAPLGVKSLVQLVLYPLVTPAMSIGAARLFGDEASALLPGVLMVVAVVLTLCAAGCLLAGNIALLKSGERPAMALRRGAVLYLGIIALGGVVSLALGTTVLYYRYLVIALPPLLLALAVGVCKIRARGRWRALAGAMLAVLALFQTMSAVELAYDPANSAVRDAVLEVAYTDDGERRPVVSNDIIVLGTLATHELVDGGAGETSPELGPELVYADDISGYWSAAYDCFAPALTCTEDTEALASSAPNGEIVWLSRNQGEDGAAVKDLLECGFTKLDAQTIWSPYERDTYVITLLRVPDSR